MSPSVFALLFASILDMMEYLEHRLRDGTTIAVLRVTDSRSAEVWSPSLGWVPADLEWTGIGGSVEFDSISRERAIELIAESDG